MTSFTFLHAADLHLGSPFVGLAVKDRDVAANFAAASRAAFSDLVTRAIDAKVAFVVIAGDLYDGDWRDNSIGLFFNREVARLDRAGIPAFVLKGNHDAESIVTRTISTPDSVSTFPSHQPKTFRIDDLKVALHGRSFAERAVTENIALAYPDPLPGWFNIGVLHTSCEGHPQHANYAPCTVQQLVLRGYDYWALGHVHDYAELSKPPDPWVVFPGNLQGRSIRECGPKGAVLVTVADGHVSKVDRLIVDRARWADILVDVTGTDDEDTLLRQVEHALGPAVAEADGRPMAVRVHLIGTTRLHGRLHADPPRITDEVQAAAQRAHADIWLERLRIRTSAPHDETDASDALTSLDLAAMLDTAMQDAALQTQAAALADSIMSKMPGGILGDAMDGEASPAQDLQAILADARALVLARALAGSKC